MEHNRQFFVILSHFLPFNPTNNPKNQNFEKMKKVSGDNIILLQCTKNHYHTIPEIWHVTDLIFFIFCPFTPLKAQKIKIKKKKMKKKISSFYTCVPKIMII